MNDLTIAKTIGNVMRDKLADLRKELREAGPTVAQVKNIVETPEVHVHIDMTPVAQALDKMTVALGEQNALTAELVKALQRPVEIKSVVNVPEMNWSPVVNVPKSVINVAAPVVNVAPARIEMPERKAKSFTIVHDDGTKSTVESN